MLYSAIFALYMSTKIAQLLEQMNREIKDLYYELNDSKDKNTPKKISPRKDEHNDLK